MTADQVEDEREREEAERRAEANLTLDQALSIEKKGPKYPPSTYWELKITLATFCALLFTLFRGKCDYYRGAWKLYRALTQANTKKKRRLFTAQLCREIVWAIIDNGRAFFNQVLTWNEVRGGGYVDWPMATLDNILLNIKRIQPIGMADFPPQWVQGA